MPVVAFVGGVGVGKTHWGRRLQELLPSATFVEEDTSRNLYLSEFYSDMKKWGFHSRISMLTMVLTSMLEVRGSKDLVILDRCVDELIVFATKEYEEGNLTEKEFALYRRLYEDILELLPRPDLYVYFRCSAQTSYVRVNRRGRDCEKNVSLEFLGDVIARYDRWRAELSSDRVLDVDTDEAVDIEALADKIFEKLNGRE
jgi:deoxyadenosine/deoxycytidine kinase